MAELDNPLMNSMNESQHYESHVEGNEGRVHFMKGEEEEQKGSGKRSEENGERETNTVDAAEPTSKGVSTSSTSSTNVTSTTTNSTNVVSNPTNTNNTNNSNITNNATNTTSRINHSGEKYMDYHHPSREADPYLYSLYYQMDFIEDDKGEKTYV